MYQLITIFFDNEQFKFEVQFKPIKSFIIIFNLMNNSNNEKIEYISLVHDYLAKYIFIDILIKII
jgi:hypothetical protein